MAHNFGTRDEVKNDSQDLLVFDINYTPRQLGKTYRVIGAVLPLDDAPIVHVGQVEEESIPRYKALAAICLAGLIAGTSAIALMANTGVNDCERNRLTSIE